MLATLASDSAWSPSDWPVGVAPTADFAESVATCTAAPAASFADEACLLAASKTDSAYSIGDSGDGVAPTADMADRVASCTPDDAASYADEATDLAWSTTPGVAVSPLATELA